MSRVVLLVVLLVHTSLISGNLVENDTNTSIEIARQEEKCMRNDEFPWISVDFVYSQGVLGLHTEIEQFYKYMQPTPTEYELRKNVVDRINSIVQKVWPNARVQVFGSFLSGLALPNSDIDLMVIGASGESQLHRLAAKLVDIAVPNTMIVRDNVRIPIIEFIDRESKLNIDMPFHDEPTLKVAALVTKYQHQYPALVKLVLVLKQYLKQRHLNDVFTGGISSYAVTLMCISFFQMHPTYKGQDDANLGELLLGFLKLYGRKFDYEHMGITIKNGGKYLPRNQLPCKKLDELFCIDNPVHKWLNACEETYRAADVKKAFNDAYVVLSKNVSSNKNSTNDCAPHSSLGQIVHVADDIIDYRKWVRNAFEHKLKNPVKYIT